MKQFVLTTLYTALFGAALLSNPAFGQAGEEQAPTSPPIPPRDDAASAADLQQAYRKEYAFLEAQLRDLQARLSRFDGQARTEIAREEGAISQLENELIGLQGRSERLTDLLVEAERSIEAAEDSQGLLDATYTQAISTLEPYGNDAFRADEFANAGDAEKIRRLFDTGSGLVQRLGQVWAEPGVFYLADGNEVQGQILRVGNIAAYGVSSGGSGALAPAGEGRLKLWPEASADTAEALMNNARPDYTKIFLFESATKAIEEKQGKTLLGVINSGGTIAWVIVALGLLGLMLILLRIFFLRSASASTGKIVGEVGDLVRRGELKQALEACKRHKGSTSRVVSSAIRNLDRDREHLEDIVSEAILHESSHLNRFGSFILVIAAVAPLLGLLGTVTGMISTFDVITEFGTGDPKLLSGGISIALVTTEIGLAVAIPALIFGNLLSGWAEGIKDDMEKAALRVINIHQDARTAAA